jgi:hypothetical protein
MSLRKDNYPAPLPPENCRLFTHLLQQVISCEAAAATAALYKADKIPLHRKRNG